MKLIDGLPIIGLAPARGLVGTQQVGDGEQTAIVTILIDAQALLRLSDRGTRNAHLLAACILIVVSLPDFETDGIAGSLLQSCDFFCVGAFARQSSPFRSP